MSLQSGGTENVRWPKDDVGEAGDVDVGFLSKNVPQNDVGGEFGESSLGAREGESGSSGVRE
jgi:hypothetical protein